MTSDTLTLQPSWVASANAPGCPFPLNNLPYGVFEHPDYRMPRCGVAIGDQILDLTPLLPLYFPALPADVFAKARWNEFMELGPAAWLDFRQRLTALLAEGAEAEATLHAHLVPMEGTSLHMPFKVREFTDFYAGRHHAENVGTMFRGPENALPPNWLHMPIGYNGRASSVRVSGTDIHRPWGQLKAPDAALPEFAPSRRFDFELELGAIVGTASDRPLSVSEAQDHIFGFVLLNDWSARDIQTWEYQPLGPFQSKATATTISPWIVTSAALAPFQLDPPPRSQPLLPHLADAGPMFYDIDLAVTLTPEGGTPSEITRTNARELYYSAAQQLAHHSSAGCPMNAGDLLGSGTISGPEKSARGAMLELSWGGKEPLTLASGETRSFLEDGDRVTLQGQAQKNGVTIGFGDCSGTLRPARPYPT